MNTRVFKNFENMAQPTNQHKNNVTKHEQSILTKCKQQKKEKLLNSRLPPPPFNNYSHLGMKLPKN